MNLLDDRDDGGSGLSLKINQDFAAKYDAKKRGEELSKRAQRLSHDNACSDRQLPQSKTSTARTTTKTTRRRAPTIRLKTPRPSLLRLKWMLPF